jgi:hypothetical protein
MMGFEELPEPTEETGLATGDLSWLPVALGPLTAHVMARWKWTEHATFAHGGKRATWFTEHEPGVCWTCLSINRLHFAVPHWSILVQRWTAIDGHKPATRVDVFVEPSTLPAAMLQQLHGKLAQLVVRGAGATPAMVTLEAALFRHFQSKEVA